MHINSEQDWIDYIEDRVDAAKRARFENHLEECADCRDFEAQMRQTELALMETAVEINNKFAVSEEESNLALAKVLARILDSEAREQNLGRDAIKVRLEQLEDILAAMCGSWTAINALRVAAEGTLAKTPAKLTEETWLPFLERLKSIASVFCGDTGAKLVWEYGQL
jgi:hypothetical protein